MRTVAGALAILVLGACAPTSLQPSPTATSSPSSAPTLSKPPSTQAPLPLPTYVRWAVDKSNDASRPYLLVLIYDGVATNFRIVDATGMVVLRVPIIGSGVFGSETCAVKARAPGKQEGFTGLSIDTATLQQFMSNAATYKAEADTVGPTSVTVPLTDTGCRT